MRPAAPRQTIANALRSGARLLHGHSDSPRLDAELLLGKTLDLTRAALIARGDEPMAGDSDRTYARLLERRVTGAPVAYLTGRREFWSLPLHITPAVLVPRPETELLVELALEHLPAGHSPRDLPRPAHDRSALADGPHAVLDLGTGSGAIALAIASERPQARLVGIDISPAALDVARENARRLGLERRIDWRLGSWFTPVHGERFDLIVANPPYIAAHDPALATLAAEPKLALCAGPTGLECLATIIGAAAAQLAAGAYLLLEHGSSQAPAVAQLLGSHGFEHIRSHPDLSGKPRVTLGAAPGPSADIASPPFLSSPH